MIIYTSSSETKEDLLSLIADNKFNKRTVILLNNIINEDEKVFQLIAQEFCKLFCYYNQLGNRFFHSEDSNKIKQQTNAHKINFIVCGKPGVGKSTFINEFFQEQLCLEGEQMSCTNGLIQFYHKKYLLSIYDTPGFENEKHVNDVLDLIKYSSNANSSKSKEIHMILYLINSQTRILESDLYFLKAFDEWKKKEKTQVKIIFILTQRKRKISIMRRKIS